MITMNVEPPTEKQHECPDCSGQLNRTNKKDVLECPDCKGEFVLTHRMVCPECSDVLMKMGVSGLLFCMPCAKSYEPADVKPVLVPLDSVIGRRRLQRQAEGWRAPKDR